MSSVSPTPRRVRTPSWFDLRLVFGVALVLGSIGLGAIVLSRADSTRPVLAVNRDLAAGTVLADGDLRTVRIRVSGSGAVYVDKRNDAIGKVLSRALGNGDLVPVSALGTADASETTLTIPVDPQNAPSVERGQRVAVWISTQYCRALLVVGDVTVQDVRKAGTGALSATSAQSLVVRTARPLAERVVTALGLSQVTVRVGVLSGPPEPDANTDLADIATCAAPAKAS